MRFEPFHAFLSSMAWGTILLKDEWYILPKMSQADDNNFGSRTQLMYFSALIVPSRICSRPT